MKSSLRRGAIVLFFFTAARAVACTLSQGDILLTDVGRPGIVAITSGGAVPRVGRRVSRPADWHRR